MKEVMAVIRINKMNATKTALCDAGITSFTAREAYGRGKGLVDFKALDGAKEGIEEAVEIVGQGQRLIPKRILTVIVPDKLVNKTVQTLIKVNQTGNAGDGKIFVLPLIDSVRIRTGEKGDKVLD